MARSAVKYTGMAVKEEVEPALGDAVANALTSAVFLWHRSMLPGHFETGGVAKYGYSKRTKKYMLRKAKKQGHQRPLVYTGQSERMAKMAVRAQIKTSGKKKASVQGLVSLPQHFYMRRKSGSGPDKLKELGATTPDERSRLSGEIAGSIPRELKRRPGRTRTERL